MDIQTLKNTPLRRIDISGIETVEGPYTMSYGFNLTDLKKSIMETGLIYPPILVKNPSGNMDIVTGFRRILALKSLGIKSFFHIDLSECGISPFELLLLNLHDNLIVRKLNFIEIGMVIKRLSSYISKDTIKSNYFPMLGLKRNQDLDACLKLELTDARLKDAIAQEEISIKMAIALIDRDAESRNKLLELVIDLNINFNYQLQLIDILDDISFRDNLSISEILDAADCSRVLGDDRLNNPQKIKKIFYSLRSLRNPCLHKSEKNFNQMIAGLGLPHKVKINHSPFFEAGDYRMEIMFEDGSDLREKLLLLSRLKDLEKIKDPWPNEPK